MKILAKIYSIVKVHNFLDPPMENLDCSRTFYVCSIRNTQKVGILLEQSQLLLPEIGQINIMHGQP